MDWSHWITLGIGLAGAAVTILGTAIKLTWWLGARLDNITTSIKEHEIKDEERQTEVLQRLTRVETLVLNGGRRSHIA